MCSLCARPAQTWGGRLAPLPPGFRAGGCRAPLSDPPFSALSVPRHRFQQAEASVPPDPYPISALSASQTVPGGFLRPGKGLPPSG